MLLNIATHIYLFIQISKKRTSTIIEQTYLKISVKCFWYRLNLIKLRICFHESLGFALCDWKTEIKISPVVVEPIDCFRLLCLKNENRKNGKNTQIGYLQINYQGGIVVSVVSFCINVHCQNWSLIVCIQYSSCLNFCLKCLQSRQTT